MDPGDSDILALLATDLRHSYEQLVSTYWHQLKVFVLRQAGSPREDAEDIVQEAFVRAYYALERYPAQRILALKVRPWLYKITWSVYCNYTERSKLPQSVPLDTSTDSAFLELEDDSHEQPEEIFENEERRRELVALVDTLPQRYRQVVSLHYFEDLGYQEIADIFNQPAGTVRVSVHRGIGLLRKALEVYKSKVETNDGA
jgi:RNA polymerase sigma-70 factor (ECF subfamily)